MNIETRTVADWANFPVIRAEVATPADREEMRSYTRAHERLIARGNGRCYGDAALAPHMVCTLALDKVIDFDPATGMVECEAGVLLSDLLKMIVPAGCFFHVTPGIKFITVGGAIASDVHGKNHPSKGCFSNWLISFELMTADGQIQTCSRTENPLLFWQTCGGMGWTGIILSAKFQLMKIASVGMRQLTVRAAGLEDIFRAFEENREWMYAAGWVDATASGSSFGRGAVYFAEHEHTPSSEGRGDVEHTARNSTVHSTAYSTSPLPSGAGRGEGLTYPQKKTRNVPFFAPSWILNPLSINLHNRIIFNKLTPGERFVDLDKYFYPLDSLQNWNRLYGRRGFVQYQFCLPEKNAFDGMRRILETIRKSPETPFLTVLKRHGERPAEAVHSFPIRGYSLALDFPRTRTIFDLVNKLDDLVWSLDGKIYLTKDACSASRMGRVDPAAFGEEKFMSLLRERLRST